MKRSSSTAATSKSPPPALAPPSEDARASAPQGAAAPSSPLLGRLRLTRAEDGAGRIEAPPEAADELLGLLEGLVALLQQARTE